MFRIGDTVIHPGYGAGTVVDIGELLCLGSDKPYYSIELSDGSRFGTREKEGSGIPRPCLNWPDMARRACRSGDAVPRSRQAA